MWLHPSSCMRTTYGSDSSQRPIGHCDVELFHDASSVDVEAAERVLRDCGGLWWFLVKGRRLLFAALWVASPRGDGDLELFQGSAEAVYI
jgi:hypothetical protein